jgi:stress-induced morphogen
LLDALEAEHVEVVDNTDGNCSGAKLELIVVSKQFEGLGLLKRHQKVNEVLSSELKSEQIHALSMKTWTPEQYASKK